MIVFLGAFAGHLKRLCASPGISVERTEIEAMEEEVSAMLDGDKSWVSQSSLVQLFRADIEQAKELLDKGDASAARSHIKDASATRHCIRLNLRSANRASSVG